MFLKPVLLGPTGHTVPTGVAQMGPMGMVRAKHLALQSLRKAALTNGVELTKLDFDGSGDASDTDTDTSSDEVPSSDDLGGA